MTLLLGNVEADDDLAKVAIPTGFIKAFPSFSVPALDVALGWTLCDSKEVNLPVSQGGAGGIYDALWGVIGNTFNTSGGIAAPGTGKFRVPGLMYNGSVAGTCGRIPAGSGSTVTRGSAAGSNGHSHGVGTLAFPGGHRHHANNLNAYHMHGTSQMSLGTHAHVVDNYPADMNRSDDGWEWMASEGTYGNNQGFSPSWNDRENYTLSGYSDYTTPNAPTGTTAVADAPFVAVIFAVKL